jgi:hypothetical protein
VVPAQGVSFWEQVEKQDAKRRRQLVRRPRTHVVSDNRYYVKSARAGMPLSDLHLVSAQVLVVQTFQPLAQVFAGDAIGSIGCKLRAFENLVVDKDGTVDP